jgi:hypothetical protein
VGLCGKLEMVAFHSRIFLTINLQPVEKFVDCFCQFRLNIPDFPLAKSGWILLVAASSYLSERRQPRDLFTQDDQPGSFRRGGFATFPQFAMNLR